MQLQINEATVEARVRNLTMRLLAHLLERAASRIHHAVDERCQSLEDQPAISLVEQASNNTANFFYREMFPKESPLGCSGSTNVELRIQTLEAALGNILDQQTAAVTRTILNRISAFLAAKKL